MPFILSDWWHETRDTWPKCVEHMTHTLGLRERTSIRLQSPYVFFFCLFYIQFRANAHSTVALSIQFLGHINCFSCSARRVHRIQCVGHGVSRRVRTFQRIFTTVWIILNYLTRNMSVSFGLFGHLRSLFHFGRNRLRVIEMNLWPFRSVRLKMWMPPQPCHAGKSEEFDSGWQISFLTKIQNGRLSRSRVCMPPCNAPDGNFPLAFPPLFFIFSFCGRRCEPQNSFCILTTSIARERQRNRYWNRYFGIFHFQFSSLCSEYVHQNVDNSTKIRNISMRRDETSPTNRQSHIFNRIIESLSFNGTAWFPRCGRWWFYAFCGQRMNERNMQYVCLRFTKKMIECACNESDTKDKTASSTSLFHSLSLSISLSICQMENILIRESTLTTIEWVNEWSGEHTSSMSRKRNWFRCVKIDKNLIHQVNLKSFSAAGLIHSWLNTIPIIGILWIAHSIVGWWIEFAHTRTSIDFSAPNGTCDGIQLFARTL